ncbi:hypothetical protein BDV25DRAFT_150510, partial [Aspergillus avenaceus]
ETVFTPDSTGAMNISLGSLFRYLVQGVVMIFTSSWCLTSVDRLRWVVRRSERCFVFVFSFFPIMGSVYPSAWRGIVE